MKSVLLLFAIAIHIWLVHGQTKIQGNFKYCDKEECSNIDEIQVIENFKQCSRDPFVQFINRKREQVQGFLNMFGELVGKSEEVECSDKTSEYNFKDFSILRTLNKAFVKFDKKNLYETKKSNLDSDLADVIFEKYEKNVTNSSFNLVKDLMFYIITFCCLLVFAYKAKTNKDGIKMFILNILLKCLLPFYYIFNKMEESNGLVKKNKNHDANIKINSETTGNHVTIDMETLDNVVNDEKVTIRKQKHASQKTQSKNPKQNPLITDDESEQSGQSQSSSPESNHKQTTVQQDIAIISKIPAKKQRGYKIQICSDETMIIHPNNAKHATFMFTYLS